MKHIKGSLKETTIQNSSAGTASDEQVLISIETTENLSVLQGITPQWDDLSRHVIEANVYYESWMLIPSWESFAVPNEDFIALIWLDKQKTKLGGLIPLCRDSGYRRVPIERLTTWKHLHCFSRVPLIRSGYESEVLGAFLRWLNESELSSPMLTFMDVDRHGPFATLLVEQLAKRGECFDDLYQFSRPVLQTSKSYNQYLQDNLNADGQSALEQKANCLNKLGKLRYETLDSHAAKVECESWVNDFLELEKSGVKGKDGTALKCQDNESQFFTASVLAGVGKGQVLMLRLLVDEKPIAISLTLLAAQATGFSFKTAFDEKFTEYAPSLLLEHEATRVILDDLELSWTDSCAQPETPFFENLWHHERLISHIHIAQKKWFPQLLIKVVLLIKKGNDRLT